MIIVRPSRFSDLPGIEKLVNESAARLSTLPADRERLGERLDLSSRSFAGDPEIAGKELFLFVLADTENKEILGTSGIECSAGNGAPFYNYRLDELIHSSQALNVYNKVDILYMTHELTGTTRLCSLSIANRYRNTEYFDLLSRSRILFMNLFSERFNTHVIVEIQGVQNSSGASPFWESLGRHFFQMDFATADYYSNVKSKTMIAELMPPQPIYVPLLSSEAQAVISQPHAEAENNCRFLYKEGFKLSRYVDIFDGGPTLEAQRADLLTSTAMHTKQAKLTDHATGLNYLVGNTRVEDFRVGISKTAEGLGDVVRLQSAAAEAIGVDEGDSIACVAL